MISIRLSLDEYELLKNEYTSRGIRSVSAFAREALQRVIEATPAGQPDLHAEVRLLGSKLATLQSEFSQLSCIVAEGLLAKIKD